MSILTASNLTLSFGDFDLFTNISVTVANDSKIALIGSNGVGKTSLLLILAGINAPSSGKVFLAKGRKLGYLRQEAMETFADRENTVFAEMLTVFDALRAQQERLTQLETRMATGEHADELLEEYGSLLEAFEHAGGYDYELRIQQTLTGLGIEKSHWHMPLKHLSGGQKTRALLARLLLEKPDLLMLDEPTNHLDIEAVEWLERTLREWDGAVLIVSHDRYFLDNTVNTVWEMNGGRIESFSGNYSAYLLQRDERWEYYERVFEEEKSRLLNEVDFIQRNWVRASTHARALGMLRKVTRELAIVQTHGILALRNGMKWSEMDLRADKPLDVIEAVRQVNAIAMQGNRPPRLRPRLAGDHNSGNIVLRVEEAVIGYPGRKLFTARDVELRRGECAALIGPNGSGKTTFLRTILGQIEPLDGEVRLGASLQIGYFAQVQDALNGQNTVIDELTRHKEMLPNAARSYLAQYLFRGEDVFKPVSALSGGERARLALAILGLQGVNFLVLDEPTNHLDIPAQEALQDVMDSFKGAILLVSHDRYLINLLATQIWELRGAKLNVFRGGYREFTLRQAANTASAASAARKILLKPRPLVRDNSKETRKREQALSQIEERIREQEQTVQELSKEMQRPGKRWSYEQIQALSLRYAQAQAKLESLMADWEKLAV